MRKRLVVGTSTALLMTLTACTGLGTANEPVEAVYGPPSTMLQSADDEPIEDVYGPPTSFYGDDEDIDEGSNWQDWESDWDEENPEDADDADVADAADADDE